MCTIVERIRNFAAELQAMTTETPKRIPYGKQNWEDVRLDNFYYVDKDRKSVV